MTSADDGVFILYGVRRWGSAIVEAMLAQCDLPYRMEAVDGFDQPGPPRDRLLAVNPLAQVPTLILPDGTVMTETAAIALHLNDIVPAAGLIPPVGDPKRPAFLRLLIWLVANVYPTFTYGDYPERWTDSAAAPVLLSRTNAHCQSLWTWFETQVDGRPWAMGDRITALDIYVACMTRWRPGAAWFADHCPKLAAIANEARSHPRIGPVLKRNYGD